MNFRMVTFLWDRPLRCLGKQRRGVHFVIFSQLRSVALMGYFTSEWCVYVDLCCPYVLLGSSTVHSNLFPTSLLPINSVWLLQRNIWTPRLQIRSTSLICGIVKIKSDQRHWSVALSRSNQINVNDLWHFKPEFRSKSLICGIVKIKSDQRHWSMASSRSN